MGLKKTTDKNGLFRGAWVAQLVKQLPSARVMIPESWDRVPHRAPSSAGSLLLPLTLSPLMLFLSRLLSSKKIKYFFKKLKKKEMKKYSELSNNKILHTKACGIY